jgi:hypothetical protein
MIRRKRLKKSKMKGAHVSMIMGFESDHNERVMAFDLGHELAKANVGDYGYFDPENPDEEYTIVFKEIMFGRKNKQGVMIV